MNTLQILYKIYPGKSGLQRSISIGLLIFSGIPVNLSSQNVVIQEVVRGKAVITSPSSVRMLPGFKAVQGSSFRAYIGNTQPASSTHSIVIQPSNSLPPNGTTGKNYIRTISYREPEFTEPSSTSFKQITEFAYFDGLGRPMQTVGVGTSPSGKDIIQSVLYDNMGREIYKPLPFVADDNSSGNFRSDKDQSTVSAYYNNGSITGIEASGRAYTQIGYDNSPLNRVVSQTGPGTAWENKPVTINYLLNEVDVPSWAVSEAGNFSSFNYLINSLIVTENIDEQGNTTREYKDNQGKVVQKSSLINGEWLRTAYIYDDRDLLRCVVPPEASDPSNEDLCYYYSYDHRKRMAEKRIPGGGRVLMVYDKRDRLRCTQNSLQTNEWSYIKYDELNRPVITGIIKNYNADTSAIRIAMEAATSLNENRENASAYYAYNNQSFPGSNLTAEVHTATYYDNYEFIQPLNLTGTLTTNNYDETGYNISAKYDNTPIGQVTGTLTRVLSSSYDSYKVADSLLYSANYYDSMGHLLRTISEHHMGGKDVVTQVYEHITYAILKTKQRHFSGASETLALEKKFKYDHAGRLLATIAKVNQQAPFTMNTMVYNELGQLITKYLHANDTTGNMAFIQKVDNQYNIRGWLTRINDPSLSSDNDLFGMQLCYESSAALGGLNNSTGYYNGNIVGMKWSVKEGSMNMKGYRFSYDALNRLKTSSYAEGSTLNDKKGYFDENINQYDKNGNIKSLTRKYNNAVVDSLNYSYYTGTNQILSIADYGAASGMVEDYPGTSANYVYDANGNVIHDASRNTTLEYFKTLNIPKAVDFGNDNRIFYHYTAAGNKLLKHVKKQDGTQEYTHYIGNIVYENGKLSYVITEEGRLVNTGTNDSLSFVYEYNLKDHLGNTRVTFLGKTLPGNAIEVTGSSDYYPFGLAMSQYSIDISADFSKNKYLYNGKEIQDDNLNGKFFGWLDYGARFYDPQIGRWHTKDPLSEWHFNSSPYAYCLNNPINFIDPFGMDTISQTQYTNDKPYDPENDDVVEIDEVTCTPQSQPATAKKPSLLRRIWDAITGDWDGNGGNQRGGIPLTTEGPTYSPTKQTADHPDKEVNIDDLLPVVGGQRGSTRVSPGPLNIPKAINKAGKAVNEIKNGTSDKDIVNSSTGSAQKTNANGQPIDNNGRSTSNTSNYPPRPDIPASPADGLPDSTKLTRNGEGVIYYWPDSTRTYRY